MNSECYNKVTACIVTYNNKSEVIGAYRSLFGKTVKYPLKLYVSDNASADGTADWFADKENVEVLNQGKNIGFGAAHNAVLKEQIGEYHFVINPDIIVSDDVISEMVDFMEENPDVVIAMPRICNADGSEQKLPKERPTFVNLFLGRLAPLGGIFRRIRNNYVWADRETDEVTDIDFCSGCFFCIRGSAFKELNGFDERYFMYLEDADLTMRAKRLGRVVMAPQFSVMHIWHRESAKSLKYLFIHIISSLKFLDKWRSYRQ